MNILKKSLNNLMYAINLVLSLILIVMVLLIFTQVVLRYVFNSPLQWVEETTMLLLVWYGYITIGILVKEKGHIAIEYFYLLASKNIQKYLNIFIYVSLIFFSFLMINFGFDMTINAANKQLPASHLPKFLLYLPMIISGLLILLFS